MTQNDDGATDRIANRVRVRRIVVLGLGALLIWFTPQIIMVSPLRYILLDALREHYQGAVHYGSAQVSWLRPISFSEVQAFDLHGEVLLSAQQITTEKSLLGLLLGGRNIGTITVDQPQLFIKLRHDGSNLEDALPPQLSEPTSPTSEEHHSARRQMTIRIVDGSAEVVDERTKRSLTVESAAMTLALHKTQAAAVELEASADIGINGRPTGDLALKLSYTPAESFAPPAKEPPLGKGQFELETNHFPLSALNPWTQRWDLRTDGWCDTRLRGSLQGARLHVNIDTFTASDLAVVAPRLLPDESFQQPQVELNGSLTVVENTVSLQAFELRSSVAQLRGSGTLPWATTANDITPALATAISHADQQFSGSLDLPALAATLPRTIRLKQDAQLTAGKLIIQLQGETLEDARKLTGQVTATGVTGVVAGQVIPLGEPIDLGVTLKQTDKGLGLDRLFCQSAFLAIDGGGLLTQGQINLTGDLSKFVQQFGPLLQLDQTSLSGTMQGIVRWEPLLPRGTEIDGEVLVSELIVESPDSQPWRERQLKVTANGHVVSRDGNQLHLTQGDLAVSSATDNLTWKLPQAAEQPNQQRWAECVVSGDLSRWQARLQPFIGDLNMELAGRIDLRTQLSAHDQIWAVQKCKLTVFDFQCRNDHLAITEPQLNIQGDGSWNHSTREARSNNLTLTGSALAVRADRLALLLSETDFRGDGQLGFRGDVQRLSQWWKTDEPTSQTHLAGEVIGNLTLTHQGNATQIALNSTINRLDFYEQDPARVQSPPRLQWSEPNVQVVGTATYDNPSQTATITRLEAGANDTARAMISGTLREPTGACQVDLQGQLTYDLGRVATRLRPWLGADLELSGEQTRQWFLKGPLFDVPPGKPTVQTVSSGSSPHAPANLPKRISEQLSGNASIVWEQGKYAGLIAGPGEVQAHLDRGILAVDPIQVALSGGQLAAEPKILLNEKPRLIVLDKGPVLQNVQISAEMCRGWLKYVAPVMADATEVRGSFSTDLDGAIMPLSAPTTGNVKGRLHVHSARVGPGSVSRDFLAIVQQVAAIVRGRNLGTNLAATQWLDMPEQTVEFQLVNGRIHHRGMQFVGGDEVIIRTTGSVGLDQTLDLIAEIPVRDTWADKSDWAAGLRGQSFQIPIRGTLSDPSVDSRALQQIGKQALRGTANKLLEEGINRGLQELFGN